MVTKLMNNNIYYILTTVLKTGPDRPVQPIQPGTGSQSGSVKTPKTGQKPGLNRKFKKKKNGLMSGSIFKTMILT